MEKKCLPHSRMTIACRCDCSKKKLHASVSVLLTEVKKRTDLRRIQGTEKLVLME